MSGVERTSRRRERAPASGETNGTARARLGSHLRTPARTANLTGALVVPA